MCLTQKIRNVILNNRGSVADKEFGARLKALRESVGLPLKEAANRLGFSSYQILSNIEAGTREVKASELNLFSRAYFCSLSNLLGEEKMPHGLLMWRKTPEKRAEVEQQILYFCEQYHLLEKLLNINLGRELGCEVRSKEAIRTDADVDALADDTRKTLDLGRKPAFTLAKVLEQNYGVKIIYRHFLGTGSAASMVDDEFGPVIVVNANEPPWGRNYDIGHELFHIVTSKAVTPDDVRHGTFFGNLENKAERFSSTLLLPESEIRKEINDRLKAQNHIAYSDLVDIARDFGVSTIALLYRLVNLKFMKFEQAQSLRQDEDLKGIDRTARQDEWGDAPVSERFCSLAIRSLRRGLISRGKFAEIIEIDRSDIDAFIENSGLMEAEGSAVEIMAS